MATQQLTTSNQPHMVLRCRDEDAGLCAVIVIDDTTLGPGLGGVRHAVYADESEALTECLRLAAAMTRKNAVAQLPYGGAKSVVLARRGADRPRLMRRFGEFVAQTHGQYLPGVDMGTTVDDLALIGSSGATVTCAGTDPSPATALGVWAAVRAAVAHLDGRETLDGVRVLVQGVGHVGSSLARLLADDGARVMLADVDAERSRSLADELGGSTVAAEVAASTPCDVLVPCAVARLVTPTNVAALACRMLVPAANDTLSDAGCATMLAQRDILYVPDFVANAGGVVAIHADQGGWAPERLRNELLRIGDRVGDILAEGDALGSLPLAVAEDHAARRIAAGREVAAV